MALILSSKTWTAAALGGMLAGLGACGRAEAPLVVPGAPAGDPAGVPAMAGEAASAAEKHQCASNGSCGAMGADDAGAAPAKVPAPPR